MTSSSPQHFVRFDGARRRRLYKPSSTLLELRPCRITVLLSHGPTRFRSSPAGSLPVGRELELTGVLPFPPSCPTSTVFAPTATSKQIFKQAGIRGFYRGLGPTVLGYLPTWAIYFSVYDEVKSRLAASDGGDGKSGYNTLLSGGLGEN